MTSDESRIKFSKKANVVENTLLKMGKRDVIIRACFYDGTGKRSGERIMFTGRWWNAFG
jgi:hypothetical protein